MNEHIENILKGWKAQEKASIAFSKLDISSDEKLSALIQANTLRECRKEIEWILKH